MSEEKKTVLDYLASDELKAQYRSLCNRNLYRKGNCLECDKRKRVNNMLERFVGHVLENPKSPKALATIKVAQNILGRYEDISCKSLYQNAIELVIEAVAKDNPDVAVKFLEKVCQNCDDEYLDRIYNMTQTQKCLDIITSKLNQEYENKNPESFYREVLLYKYAVKSQDENLLKKALLDKERTILVGVKALMFLREDVGYGPFFEHLKHSGVKEIKLDLTGLKNGDVRDRETLKQIISGHDELLRISSNDDSGKSYGNMKADTLLPNKHLKEINISHAFSLGDPEKLLTELPDLESLTLRCDGSSTNGNITYDAQKLYDALMARKPEKLEYISSDFTEEQASDLMKKYPTLLVKGGNWDLYCRNEWIIGVLNKKNRYTMAGVVAYQGLIECLEAMDPKNRPSFFELVMEDIFNHAKNSYGKDYLATLDKVYELCDFSAHQKKADFFKAIEHKDLISYLKSLPEEERISVDCLTNNFLGFGSPKIITIIQKAYGEKANDVIVQWLDISPQEQIEKFCAQKSMPSVVRAYAAHKKYQNTMNATQAAFEKWKKEHAGKSE